MFRQIVVRPLFRASYMSNRTFTAATARMGEGDTGAPRTGGTKADDQFTRREAAYENLYIKEKEIEKLKALKAKLQEQRRYLDDLDEHIDQLTREQGGEQN